MIDRAMPPRKSRFASGIAEEPASCRVEPRRRSAVTLAANVISCGGRLRWSYITADSAHCHTAAIGCRRLFRRCRMRDACRWASADSLIFAFADDFDTRFRRQLLEYGQLGVGEYRRAAPQSHHFPRQHDQRGSGGRREPAERRRHSRRSRMPNAYSARHAGLSHRIDYF